MEVAIGGLGNLTSALLDADDLGKFLTREQIYLRSRLERNQHVASIERSGEAAYAIARGRHRALNVVTITHYELTADAVYELLAGQSIFDVDAIVTTNPSARGFSREAIDAANHGGVALVTFGDFLDSLGEAWH